MSQIGDLRMGHGALTATLSAAPSCLLVVTEPLRDRLVTALDAPSENVVVATTLEQEDLEGVVAEAPPVDTVAGVGGGVAIDVAKFVAYRLGVPLISAPTILSTTAYINPIAVLRDAGRSVLVSTTSPSQLVVDFDILAQAPKHLNVAGLGDILSCHTALHDWQTAVNAGVPAHPWDADVARQARLLVEMVAAHAADFRAMNERALKLIVDMHIEVVDICAAAGHGRPEAGSEHLFAEAIEEETGRGFLHGPIIGLGIDIMAELQSNDHEAIVTVMRDVGLGYSPADNGVRRDELSKTLRRLARPTADRKHTVLDSTNLDDDLIETLLDRRDFA